MSNIAEETVGTYRVNITGMTIRQIKDLFEDKWGALMWSNGGAYPSENISLQFKKKDGGITGDGRGEAALYANSAQVKEALAGELGSVDVWPRAGMHEPNWTVGRGFYDTPLHITPPQQEQAAPGAVPDGLLKRAVDLHEKAGMPWAEAEQLALSEAGIEDSHIDELTGNTDHATICSLLSKEEVREFTRTILIYGQPLLSAAPKQEPGA